MQLQAVVALVVMERKNKESLRQVRNDNDRIKCDYIRPY